MTVMTLRITTPTDLLAALPQITGQRLDDGVCRVAISAVSDSNANLVSAMLDLTGHDDPADVIEGVVTTIHAMSRQVEDLKGVILFVVSDDAEWSLTRGALLEAFVPNLGCLAVWDDQAQDMSNISAPPQTFTYGNAELTYAGNAPLTRPQIVASLQRDPEWTDKVFTGDAEHGLIPWAKAWGPVLSGKDVDLDDPILLATLGHTLTDPNQRDAIVWWVAGALPYEAVEEWATYLPERPEDLWEDNDALTTLVSRLTTIAQRQPDAYAPDAYAVLGNHYFIVKGDGIRARTCVEVALSINPEHRLSKLMTMMLDRGIRPNRSNA